MTRLAAEPEARNAALAEATRMLHAYCADPEGSSVRRPATHLISCRSLPRRVIHPRPRPPPRELCMTERVCRRPHSRVPPPSLVCECMLDRRRCASRAQACLASGRGQCAESGSPSAWALPQIARWLPAPRCDPLLEVGCSAHPVGGHRLCTPTRLRLLPALTLKLVVYRRWSESYCRRGAHEGPYTISVRRV